MGGRRNKRRALHRDIWEKYNGKSVPKHHVVIFKDGNKNNFAPSNLILISLEDLMASARQQLPENHIKNLVLDHWNNREQKMTTALLNRFNRKATCEKNGTKNPSPRHPI